MSLGKSCNVRMACASGMVSMSKASIGVMAFHLAAYRPLIVPI
jgi:hypothetical protein